jgi:hypothetical protein
MNYSMYSKEKYAILTLLGKKGPGMAGSTSDTWSKKPRVYSKGTRYRGEGGTWALKRLADRKTQADTITSASTIGEFVWGGDIQEPQIFMSSLGPGKEGNSAGGAVKRHGGGRVSGCTVGAEEWAGSNEVVGEVFVFTHIAFHGLGFVRET